MTRYQQQPGTQNPDEPILPGEVERDNDAYRPNDPARREKDEERVDEDLDNLHDKARPL
ncbi:MULTISPECIES: hypothetical protein [unclassified Pseudomonas]|uniref:hypothetical protein n=1 Tax=unclassified Pseudomonas TaxID=196821 RepID=UPI0015B78ACD|nr:MULTISPECIES: hypothetical protein [unclassified Pseudomonas]